MKLNWHAVPLCCAALAQAAVDGFLEELVIRRELADNFCFYEPRWEALEGAGAES